MSRERHPAACSPDDLAALTAAIVDARARVVPFARETPLEHSRWLSSLAPGGSTVLLKFEHLQTTGSFKLRGALNRVGSLTAEQRSAGVTAASTGNHGAGAVVWLVCAEWFVVSASATRTFAGWLSSCALRRPSHGLS